MSTVFVAPLRRAIGVAWMLALREWLADYRQSRMSVLWPLLHPLAYTGLFVLLRPLLGAEQGQGLKFAIFVFVGFVLWQSWFETLRAQMDAIRRHKGLVARGELGTGTLCMAAQFGTALQFLPRLLLMLLAAALVLQPGVPALAGLLLFSVLALLNASAIGALLQPFSALSPDLGKTVQSISLALMVTGAVFLQMPDDPSSTVRTLLAINPMGTFLNAARAPLFGEGVNSTAALIVWTGVTGLICAAIPSIGRRTLPVVIERLGG